MTPKPQANKTMDEILERLVETYYNPTPQDDPFDIVEATEELEALLTEARANERQAMLDALPEKIKYTGDEIMGIKIAISEQQVADGFTFRSTKEIDAFNDAIDQFESAIKLMGGE